MWKKQRTKPTKERKDHLPSSWNAVLKLEHKEMRERAKEQAVVTQV